MNEKCFRKWLKVKSVSNYISRIKTIERSLDIDIDSEYEKDHCSSLLKRFEKNTNEPPIPINPREKDKSSSYREGTADYASRIRKYKKFRDYLLNAHLKRCVESSDDSVPNDDSCLKEILPEERRLDDRHQKNHRNTYKKNSRYKGNHIGNAQNRFIRNLLSNLGNHSFSRKDWEETKRHFGGRCAYYGTASNDMTKDHAIPINKDQLGEHTLGNLVPACKECNEKKREQDYIEFCRSHNYAKAVQKIKEYMASRGYVPLTDDVEKANSTRAVLETAHKEVGDTADRYIALINALFFSNE